MSQSHVITLGCRLNAHEGETAAGHARAAGLNSVIVNTCAVTGESVRQAAQTIRRARRDNPEARIIVTGCAAELEPERFAAMPEVDAVVGNVEKLEAVTYREISRANDKVIRTGSLSSARELSRPIRGGMPITRAILAVQNGCDHRCTFCIIPFARGPSRSMQVEDAVAEVNGLVSAGHREVVLTGVDLTSYAAAGTTLGHLVRTILRQVPELQRLRLSSIDPAEVDDDLLQAFADEPRLMPHVHLSLQAGDDTILKRMKRRHNRMDAIRFTERVRAARADVIFGADLIAGFPTETDEMFQNTLATIAACDLTYLHIFPYSSRPGTPAARMPQLDAKIVMARAARLRQEGQQRLAAFLQRELGHRREVLMERGGRGRTRQFAEVAVESPPSAGVILDVVLIGHDGARLIGRPLTGSQAPAGQSDPGSQNEGRA